MKSKTICRFILFYALFCQAFSKVGSISMGSLSSSEGIKITDSAGSGSSPTFGMSVQAIGDVSGDGISDFIIGAPGDNSDTGKVAIIYGVKGGLPNIDIATLTTSQGFTITGSATSQSFGIWVAGLGDVNGDTIPDFAIGANGYSSNKGAAFVIYGAGNANTASYNIASLTNTIGYSITSSDSSYASAKIGTVVAAAGDFDNDGFNDVLVSAPEYNTDYGRAWVIYGKTGTTRTNIDVFSMTASDGVAIVGYSGAKLGMSIASAGKVTTSDSTAEILIGAPGDYKAFLIFGRTGKSDATIATSSLMTYDGYTIKDSTNTVSIGTIVAGGGDINNDGKLDIAVAGTDASGYSYVYFIIYASIGIDVDVSNLNLSIGFRIKGSTANNLFGSSINFNGDTSGDGLNDLIIGAPMQKDGSGSINGAVYVFLGKKGTWQNMIAEDSKDDILYGSGSYGTFGATISTNNDFNGDGIMDMVTGAPTEDTLKGNVYVVYGGTCTILSQSCKKGLSAGAIAGIVIGSIVGAALMFGSGFFINKKMKASRAAKNGNQQNNNNNKNEGVHVELKSSVGGSPTLEVNYAPNQA